VSAPAAPPEAAAPAPRKQVSLRLAFGLWFSIAAIVGNAIGAGILRAPADIATRLPSPVWFVGVWVLGGLYVLLGSNAVAELAAMLPRSGGQYVYARRALGPYAGFVVGWNDWVSTCGSMAAVGLVMAEAIVVLVPALRPWVVAIAALAVVAVGVVVWRGVGESDRAQRLTTSAKALALLVLVVACLGARVWGQGATDAPVAPLGPAPTGLALAAALVIALQGVVFAYDGWAGVTYFAEEVRDPGRQIPRALFGGNLSVIVIYVLLNISFLVALPLAAIAASSLAAASAASVVFGAWGGSVVQAIVVVAMPSTIVASAIFASRVAFALARDGAAPGWLVRVNAGGTPSAALWLSVLVGLGFLLTGTFDKVIAVLSFLFIAGYAITFASVFVLRRREPELSRPYRAWGHPWTTGLVLALSLAFLAGTVAADPRQGLVALALVVVSWPVYRLLAPRLASPAAPPRRAG
jgi:APA family basic amino acid/polyamine antiporter